MPESTMVELKVKREGGRLWLYVNAKGLHDILDAIGVGTSQMGTMYADRPRADVTIASRSNNVLSTEVFLRKEYPAKFDLSTVYVDPPPSVASLQRLTESARDQTRRILEHYQPIDITVSISRKEKPP